MFRPSSSRSGLSCSGRSKESSSSGSRSSRSGVSTRGRSPRRSPSPRGRRRLSPSSSRSSRRSPSPRRTSRVRSPSGGSQTRRGSEQRDGSLSRRISLGRHSRFACRHSPSRHSESSEEQSLQTAASNERYSIDLLERRRLSDRLGSPVDSQSDVDRDDFTDYPVFSRCLSYHQSLERYSSPERSPPSSFNRRYNKDYHSKDVSLYQLDFDMSYDHLQDISRETDRDIKLHRKHLHSPEKRGRDPKRHPCDREDRQLDVSMDPQGFLPGKQNYYKRNLSRSPSPACSDEDFKEVENSETKRSTCQDMSSSGSVIHGLTNSMQSPEPQFLHRPEKAPALPKKSVLKNRVDEPSLQVNNFLKFSNKNTIAKSANKEYQASVDNWRIFSGVQQNTFHSEQNFKSFLRQKDYQESMSESADLHDDFLLPHERAIQDGSGFLRILDRMVDSSNIQEQRRCSFLDVENEEKFLYDDDEDDANIKYPSTENLTMDSWKESLSLNPRSLSPIKSIEPNTSDGSRIEYEKISDLLKAIGLDIGVSEIGKGAARTEERLHGKKTLRSLDGLSVISHKPDSNEKDCIRSISHSPESSQKNSLSPCGSFQPSNDTSSVSISEHTKSKTLGNNNSGGSSEQSFPPVSATVSAPPSLPILPLPTPLISQYPVSHFSAFTTAQLLPNHPPPTMAPPIYNAYGHYMAYSASAWPMYTPPLRQSNPALSGVNGLVSVTMPPKPIRSNLRIIETVSTVKKNPEKKINKSVLLKIPITPNSRLRSQSSVGGTTERISERNPASEMPKVTEEDKLVSKKEAWQKKLQFLKTELDRRSKQQLQMLCNKCKKKDPLLAEVNRVQENIVKEIAQLQTESRIAETKHSQFEKISHVIKILEMPCKKASENADSLEEEKSDNTKTQENTSNSVKVMDDKEKLRAEQETRKRKLQDLKSELSRLSGQGGQILRNKNIKYKDVLLAELEHTEQKILNEINQLQLETETVEKTQSELDKDCLNKNPVCDEWRNLDHQAGLSLLQETDCNLKRKWCRKEKEDRDERSAKMARKEESAITNELREEGLPTKDILYVLTTT
ncbi:zinc finger protein 318-like [Eublepharis macularius]|uniref:Zinc finger protein 318-like n=1 Tax=Eublepharis macularius TaxID=481883 RepID=A0AA97J8X3_EUBMA|nr:zinc finger protein 318-like [Eublepharis macularius]